MYGCLMLSVARPSIVRKILESPGLSPSREAQVLLPWLPQVLYETGYAYLDVRSELEYQDIGKVKGSVNVPFVHAKRVWSAEEQKKVVVKVCAPPPRLHSNMGRNHHLFKSFCSCPTSAFWGLPLLCNYIFTHSCNHPPPHLPPKPPSPPHRTASPSPCLAGCAGAQPRLHCHGREEVP